MEQGTLSRRAFVKASALVSACAALGVTATTALSEADEAYADTPSERTVYRTICHSCIQGCPCRVYVEDGVIVKIEGDPTAPVSKGSLCLKGQSQLHTVYSPRRVLYPMKRVGERGAANASWERVTWDEAIEAAAQQIVTMMEKYGPYGIWTGTGGGGQFVSPIGNTLPYVFGSTAQISPGALQCYMPRRIIGEFVLGGSNMSMADSEVIEPFNEDSPTMKVLVLWGASPSTSQTAQSGRGLADARVNRGLKTIVIDPFMTPDAAKATVWLPVRPGSDTALILCWIRYILDNKLYDESFVKYWTNLPFLINPKTGLAYRAEEVWPDYVNPAQDPTEKFDNPAYVCFDAKTNSIQPYPYSAPEDCELDPVIITTATVNGVESKTAGKIYWEEAEPWTLEHTAEICWLKADKIEEAIKLYASAGNAGIAHGVFSDQTEVSSQVPLGLFALDSLMGYVYKPGATLTLKGANSISKSRKTSLPSRARMKYGIGWTVGYTKKWNDKLLSDALKKLDDAGIDSAEWKERCWEINRDRLGTDKYRGPFYNDMTHNQSVRIASETGEPYKLRICLEVSGNKLSNMANVNEWYKAYNALDYNIQQFPNMTSFTVEHVDLFFPLGEWAEYNSGVNLTNQNNQTFLRRAVVHLGETVPPEQPLTLIIERAAEILGKDKFFDFDYLYEGAMGLMYIDSVAKKEVWAKNYKAESWDDLINNMDKYIPIITPPEDYWKYYQYLAIADDGYPVGFGTESRKIEIYAQGLLKLARTGWPFLYPYDLEPTADYSPICVYHEYKENPLTDTEYPLVFTSGRVHHFHHGTLRHAAFNRELMPAPDCYINPKTAAEYGIEHKDWVKLTSRRGEAHGLAYLTEGLPPGVVRQERFWNPECFDSSQSSVTGGWQECNICTLTLDDVSNECNASATYRGFTVKIEKSTKPDRIWVEPKEFEPFMPTLQNEPQTEEVLFS
jgi:anaerobic selenocysteine-containing dehydrogenase